MDSSEDQSGRITGGDGQAVLQVLGDTLTLESGTISGNKGGGLPHCQGDVGFRATGKPSVALSAKLLDAAAAKAYPFVLVCTGSGG